MDHWKAIATKLVRKITLVDGPGKGIVLQRMPTSPEPFDVITPTGTAQYNNKGEYVSRPDCEGEGEDADGGE